MKEKILALNQAQAEEAMMAQMMGGRGSLLDDDAADYDRDRFAASGATRSRGRGGRGARGRGRMVMRGGRLTLHTTSGGGRGTDHMDRSDNSLRSAPGTADRSANWR